MIAAHPVVIAIAVIGIVCFMAVGASSIRLARTGKRPMWNVLLAAFVVALAVVLLIGTIVAIGL